MKDIPIVTVGLAYDCARTMHTYLLIFHQSLHIRGMKTNLICPEQLRARGIIVNDVPLLRLRAEDRLINSHSVIDPDSDLHIPLRYNKPFSYFDCRKPTQRECDPRNDDVIRIEMTLEADWHPYDIEDSRCEEELRMSIDRGLAVNNLEAPAELVI